MLELSIVFTLTVILAYNSEAGISYYEIPGYGQNQVYAKLKYRNWAIFFILVFLIFFSGLRESFNDTYAYRRGFDNLKTGLEEIKNIDWSLGENPGFVVLSSFIKSVLSKDSQVMLIIYAFLTYVPLILFYKRWSPKLWITFFLFFTAGLFVFSMAAIKQVFAMAIGVYGITKLLQGRKTTFIILIALGSTIHAYLPFYFIALFFLDKVWSKKVLIILAGVVLSVFSLGLFLDLAYVFTSNIGMDYERKALEGEGVNIFRFLVASVTPFLTYLYRKQINQSHNKALILFSNLALFGWGFMFVGLFANSVFFSRMAIYFDPFVHLCLTYILMYFVSPKNRNMVIFSALFGYILFFLYQNIVVTDFHYNFGL